MYKFLITKVTIYKRGGCRYKLDRERNSAIMKCRYVSRLTIVVGDLALAVGGVERLRWRQRKD